MGSLDALRRRRLLGRRCAMPCYVVVVVDVVAVVVVVGFAPVDGRGGHSALGTAGSAPEAAQHAHGTTLVQLYLQWLSQSGFPRGPSCVSSSRIASLNISAMAWTEDWGTPNCIN